MAGTGLEEAAELGVPTSVVKPELCLWWFIGRFWLIMLGLALALALTLTLVLALLL